MAGNNRGHAPRRGTVKKSETVYNASLLEAFDGKVWVFGTVMEGDEIKPVILSGEKLKPIDQENEGKNG